MIDRDVLRASFRRLYGAEARLFRAPGRVNLIGEHTDYNDGFVLPLAIDRETVVAGAARADSRVRACSLNFDETAEFDLAGTPAGTPAGGHWLAYVEGIARVLQSRGVVLRGADLAFFSDVPVGAGLSSSAALEVSVGLALSALSGADIDLLALAQAAQEAEHRYAGIKCGIMDQLTAALGQCGAALLIDCRSLETVPIPLDLSRIVIAICDTRIKHELASSAYNTRRAECARGVELLGEYLPGIRALRDVGPADFRKYEDRLPEPIRRRCRHVVTENARTLAAARALRAGEMEEVGRLMFLSHASLRDDYEVSCRELDLLIDIVRGVDGVVGARMTGGGFGGCTVNLVRREAITGFQEVVLREYRGATKLEAAIHIVEASDGAMEIV